MNKRSKKKLRIAFCRQQKAAYFPFEHPKVFGKTKPQNGQKIQPILAHFSAVITRCKKLRFKIQIRASLRAAYIFHKWIFNLLPVVKESCVNLTLLLPSNKSRQNTMLQALLSSLPRCHSQKVHESMIMLK